MSGEQEIPWLAHYGMLFHPIRDAEAKRWDQDLREHVHSLSDKVIIEALDDMDAIDIRKTLHRNPKPRDIARHIWKLRKENSPAGATSNRECILCRQTGMISFIAQFVPDSQRIIQFGSAPVDDQPSVCGEAGTYCGCAKGIKLAQKYNANFSLVVERVKLIRSWMRSIPIDKPEHPDWAFIPEAIRKGQTTWEEYDNSRRN